MNLQQQKELINLYNQYQETTKETIKASIKHYMDIKHINPLTLSDQTNISIHTIKQIRKSHAIYKPDFITCIILCDALEISITELLQTIPGLQLPETKRTKTKWKESVKKQFIKDYNRLNITTLCSKYNLTPRTAQEYFKNFKNDITEAEQR